MTNQSWLYATSEQNTIRLQMLHPYADTYYSAIQNKSCKDNKVQAKQSISQIVRTYCTYRHNSAAVAGCIRLLKGR